MKLSVPMKPSLLALSVFSVLSAPTLAQQEEQTANDDKKKAQDIEQIQVTGRSVSYANNATAEEMKLQQTSMTSALAVVDNLPGVLINEGDPFGSDEWSTSISMRGFSIDLSQQQIGMTVDGISNGNSNYGGGTKANRFIDTENLQGVDVSQGTSDISSRSHEALGGTLDFRTIDPGFEEKAVVSATLGENNAQKIYARYETGELARDTYGWVSFSTQENTDWMDEVATNTRDHFAGKLISRLGDVDLEGYVTYDDAREFTYQRVYGVSQFEQNKQWDGLVPNWTGVPYQDQAWRKGWVTHRENLFGYLKAETMISNVTLKGNVYYHHNEGRGDWIPYYVVDVTDDGAGNPHSELDPSTTAEGGSSLGQIFFVNRDGQSLQPQAGCESSITYPYGGAGAALDPDCYGSGAIPVSSHRHTNYNKDRYGVNADFIWDTTIADMPNTLRGGFWYEDYEREEYRSWHKLIDSATSARWENNPYWIQYNREFPVDTLMAYVENELDAGFAKFRVGAKKFDVDVAKNDLFDSDNDLDVDSSSDVLFSAGFVAPVPGVRGLEVFGGYAENFAAIKDAVLERDDTDLSVVEPERADNIDLGLRYSSPGLNASLTYYDITFDNRITFISNEDVDGIDFLEAAAGGYVNDGGVESNGIEASLDYQLNDNWGVYVSYTKNDSTYVDKAAAGNTVIGSAEDMAAISFDYKSDGYFAGFSTKYVGERYMDQANTQVVDSYTTSDFYLGTAVYNVGNAIDSMELRFTINNVFDERYLGTIAPGAAWIGAPRVAALNAKFTF
ncbi:TonB-dependent receptor domain-containing protein [Idiomarina piscisalsi]|uniref:TonB-dependent receptor domain-containing protein n=1 Tax=Idiomarina piscisalsi TaxID=1096243 RepID=UPI0013805BF2|nr:TonB-dependent receptor [Idiomarina piscisalsi]MTJ02294.1 TonB-dependent receptor [Idiomarina piscisalsi]